ncbi:MAG TPA: biotin carboxylase N-terminal domain-containing protein [Actinomycetota bacterium]|nr:biotin carboxylase N-terminal domain-containing protein [Actinomycetota bacterium]
MAEKVLIANRGEIAVRVMRTCRELGIPTVAVYSDADRDALFVEQADEAHRLGPAPPSESYLNVPAILAVAKRSKATLVHPGYGFLAEDPDFARTVAGAGMRFVGPPPEAMEGMGDKISARRTARRIGVPVVPGTDEPVSPEEALRIAEGVGFPLAVKAAYGGGGRGMHIVRAPADLREAVERSAREATAYFGRPEVYLERFVEHGHHVEAQVVADLHGAAFFLGERDCTLQRRYQKLVEESPSPIVDPGLRARIEESALALVKEVGYANAGTVEFLVDEERNPYFLEVNARLQVEHPVTEMVTGLDLVACQIFAALGERLHLAPQPRGHAIECRINAEDPYRDFLPGAGRIARFEPPGGPFVRVDAGFGEDRTIPGDYDSLLAKLVVWGEDRERARSRMLRALGEFHVEGVPTTIPFHRWVLQTTQFVDATADTRWVEHALAEAPLPAPKGGPGETSPGPGPGPSVLITAEVKGRRVPVRLWGDGVRTPPAPPPSLAQRGAAGAGSGVVSAPMQGTILQVLVEEGQAIAAGEVVCILEAMKMENHIAAAADGTVTELAVKAGQVVESGQTLAIVQANATPAGSSGS